LSYMSLLYPDSVAVIGASNDEKKVGHLIFRNLLTQGYPGGVYPVNPKGEKILGKETYKSVGAIRGPVDLAIIVTPAETVEGLAEECGKKGVESLIVISAGFGESGEDGRARESRLGKITDRYRMRLVGPNCLGIMRPGIRLNASFAPFLPPAGNVALLSQSGALGDAFIDRAEKIGLNISFFVSMGNKAKMDECDFLEICAEDPETKVIGLYLESIRDGRRFLELGQRIGPVKPIILLKSGISEKGRGAALSHTGVLAGSDAAVQAICEQAGLIRAGTTGEFLDLLRTISHQPPLLSKRIAIITNAGGPGVLAADSAERCGLDLPALSPGHEDQLKKMLPRTASIKNPIDVLGDAMADRYMAAMTAAARDSGPDGAMVILTPQVMTPAKEVAETIARVKKSFPLFPIVACFMGGKSLEEAIALLHKNGIPNFSTPESGIRMLAALYRAERKKFTKPAPLELKRAIKAREIIGKTQGLLTEAQTRRLLKMYKLPLPDGQVAAKSPEAVKIARKIGFPVTAKISSKDILHKVDIGGVRLNLLDSKAVEKAFGEIMINARDRAPKARVKGVLIQQFLPPGDEFIVGAMRDPTIGHLIMAGLGGIYTELFKDVSFRVAPVSAGEAYPMLTGLKSWKLFLGLRGKKQLDIDAFAVLISRVSLLVQECPGIKELDLNPVLLKEKGLTILDAKIVVGYTILHLKHN